MDSFIHICFCVLSAILGASFGSFCNVLIYRLPKGESIIKGGSHCTKCGKPIKFYDNIPIISYLLLGGKCRNCRQKFTARYFLVETLCMLLWLTFAIFANVYGYKYSLCCMVFTFCIVTLAFIDLENGYIPDRFSIIIAVLGAGACVYGVFFETYISWQSRLFGLLFAVVFFGGAYFISKWVLKKEGLGFGDVKLMAACGLFLGVKSVFFATLIASVIASAILVPLSIKNKEKEKEYPFAPFLGVGVILAAFLGEIAINAYLNLF